MIKFSIITVTYNSGDKLLKTVNSVLNQTYPEFEIIIKDGFSNDGSLENIPKDGRIAVYSEKDNGIYDAMNYAVKYATGDYFLFINSGDMLYSNNVLENVAKEITNDGLKYGIYYGDTFVVTRDGVSIAPDYLDDYRLITKTICHQSIFFVNNIFKKHRYEYEQFGIASDMALYIKCLKQDKISARHLKFIISNYEGGGASETVEAKKHIITVKKKIMETFYTREEYKRVVLKKFIKLYYVKEWLSCSGCFQSLYEKVASKFYKKKSAFYKNV